MFDKNKTILDLSKRLDESEKKVAELLKVNHLFKKQTQELKDKIREMLADIKK